MQDPVGADRVVRTKSRHDEAFARHVEEHDETGKKIARRSTDAQETTSNQPLSSSSSNSGANRADSKVQHRQESNDGVHEHDADMNNDDKEQQSPTEDKSHVTVSRNSETEDDADRDSKRQRLSSTATHHSNVNGGELSAMEVRKARRLEVEHFEQDGRGTSAVLVHQAQDWQRAHQGQVGRHSENQRDTQEQAGGEGVPPRVQN